MLNEDAIESLIQPIIDRQESINVLALEMIAKRINEISTMNPSDINRLKLLIQIGADIRKINAELERIINLQVSDIAQILEMIALDLYLDAKQLYEYKNVSFVPFSKNTELQKIVTLTKQSMIGDYKNIVDPKTTGFLIGTNFSNKNLRFVNLKDAYQKIIDQAIQSIKSDIYYKTVMRNSLKQLTASGLRKRYSESNYTQRIDTAIRKAILASIRAIQQAIENEIAKQTRADAKELSVHINSALDHEPIQGHIFTNEEYDKLQNDEPFEDIYGNKFSSIERAIGTWNCRHFTYAFIIGVSKPKHTQKQLDAYIRNNHKGYTLPNGKHLTMYECTQMQRQLENKIRYAKEEQMILYKAGDKDGASRARQKVVKLTQEYKIFSKNCGLKIKKDRIFVPNYKVSEA